MKILVYEEQLNNLLKKIKPTNENQEVGERSRSFAFTRKKRLFSKSELMANPNRYRKYERDLKEIDRYKFSEPKSSDKPRPEEYMDVLSSSTHAGDIGPYSYFYTIDEEDGTPSVRFFILDQKRKEYVGTAEFEMRYGGDFFVTLPYIRKEFRGQGIAKEIYKMILTMGNLVSGKAQSYQAVGLWKKLFNELPNRMVYVDDSGKEFDVYEKNGELHTTKTDTSVYDVKGGYLKIYK
jgi:GNAT superfamily N-acetyltransferase